MASTKGLEAELKIQLKYRLQYEEELKKLIEENKKDTIILVENYDFICSGCPAESVGIYVQNKIISYQEKYPERVYIRTEELFTDNFSDSTGSFYSDIDEIKGELRKGNKWNHNPERYGTDEVFDGGHTFYTVLFPSGKIQSMYIRCWLSPEERTKVKQNPNLLPNHRP